MDPESAETLTPEAAADWDSGSHSPAEASGGCGHQRPHASTAVASAPDVAADFYLPPAREGLPLTESSTPMVRAPGKRRLWP